MEINGAVRRHGEHLFRQNPERHNKKEVGIKLPEAFNEPGVFQVLCLDNLEAELEAADFTGEGWSFFPRPFSLSRRVTTPATSWRSCNALRVGMPKPAVPMNTIRFTNRHLPAPSHRAFSTEAAV